MDSKMSKYYVVYLSAEGTAEVIPETWLIPPDECMWPPYKSTQRFNKAVTDHEEPQMEWAKIPVNVIGSSQSYEHAQKMCTKVKTPPEIDDGDSEEEADEHCAKRRRGDSDDSEEEEEHTRKKKTHRSVESHIRTMEEGEQSNSLDVSCSRYSFNEDAISTILYMLEDLQSEVRNIKILLQNHLDSQKAYSEEDDLDTTAELPTRTPEELHELNCRLSQDVSFIKMQKRFTAFGGKKLSDTVRLILSNLMTNEVSRYFNWTGRGAKFSLKDLGNVCRLIKGATRGNPRFQDATDVEVEDIIKKWLQSSIDRDGGRLARMSITPARGRHSGVSPYTNFANRNFETTFEVKPGEVSFENCLNS